MTPCPRGRLVARLASPPACAGQGRKTTSPPGRAPPVEEIRDGAHQDPGGQGARRRPAPRDLRRHRAVRAGGRRAVREALRRRHPRLRPAAQGVPGHALHEGGPLQLRARLPGQEGLGRRPSPASRRWPPSSAARPTPRTRSSRSAPPTPSSENWPTSAAVFAQILERKDLTADDKIEALARRGFRAVPAQGPRHRRADLQVGALVLPADRARGAPADRLLPGPREVPPRADPHERFRAIPLRLPEKQMAIDMEEKARLLLVAQRQYIETIKLGNPQWASASGYPDRLALRGVLRRLHARADAARASGRRRTTRSARSTTKSCASGSASCSRSRCGPTSRTS